MENKKNVVLGDFLFIIVSIGILLYLFFIVVPVGDDIHIFSEGMAPKEMLIFSQYGLMTLPVCIAYWLYLAYKLRKVYKTMWILVGPIAVFALSITVLFSLSVLWGGDAFWLAFYIFPLSIAFVVIWASISKKKDNPLPNNPSQ